MWRRIPDWAVYGIGLCLYISVAKLYSSSADAPSALPNLGQPLQSERPIDGSLSVTLEGPQSGTGSAFAIDNDGTWMTARHVVDACNDVVLYIGGGEAIRTEGYEINTDSDVALIRTRWKRTPLAHDLVGQRYIGESGYFFGFPQGQAGEVTGTLLGQRRMRVRGRYNTDEPVYVWTERGRSRGLKGTLGGLSGGPVMDSDGEVIGLVSAQSRRRGRIYTVPPKTLEPYISGKATQAKREPITDKNYGRMADRLRNTRRITKVICYVTDQE